MDFLIILPILVTVVGAYMLVRLRFFFIIHPIKTAKRLLKSLKVRENFSALSLALAGTLGVGNIFGVAVGIMIGGAGSLFWMFVSAVFSAAIKYSEVVMCASEGERCGRGMMNVIEKSLGKRGKIVGGVYAALCLLLSFAMGSALQAGSVGGVATDSLGTSPVLVLAVLLVLVALGISGGVLKIEKMTSFIIPATTIIYILMSLFVIFSKIALLPSVIWQIVSSAFSLESVGGGVASFAMIRAIKEGYVSGVLSNEAGVGTSSMAHTRARDISACECGLFGIVEVLFDTVFICMLSGVVILLFNDSPAEYSSAMRLVSDSFASVLGDGSRFVLLLCVLSFAYSTIVCWYYYGNVCRRYLFGERFSKIFTALFLVFICVGVSASDIFSVRLADTLLLLMSLPTLFSLIKFSDRIVTLSEKEKLILKSNKKITKGGFLKGRSHRAVQASPEDKTRSSFR